MALATSPGVVALSPLLAEAAAFRWAINLVVELGFRRVALETDCLVLFQNWQKNAAGCSYLFSVIMDCRDLVPLFDSFELCFVKRTGNKVADFLATRSENLGHSV